MAPAASRFSTVVVLLALLVVILSVVGIVLRRTVVSNKNMSSSSASLFLLWDDADDASATSSSIATLTLEPRYFDLATTETVTLSWRTLTSDAGTEPESSDNSVSFQRTVSSSRIVANQRMVTWEGARMMLGGSNVPTTDATQMATLMHDATPDNDGRAVQALTGSFSTTDASYTVTTLSTGEIQIERTPWNMFPSSSAEVADLVDLSALSHMDDADLGNNASTNLTAGIIHRGGPVYAPLPQRRRRRRLDDEDDAVHTIDLLVVVTRRASCEFNREDDDCEVTEETTEPMDRRLALSVAQTNTALEYGSVNARIRLVEVIYLESDFDGRAGIDTLRIMSQSQDIEDYRDDAGADLAMMVTGRHPDNCGIALLNTPLSAMGYDCFGAYTFAHEIGHNFGANHDRESTPGFQVHPYGHGFALEDEFHTIMAYGCEDGSRCPMAPYFSANDQELPDGRPLGDEDHDNVRIMNENAAEMADWRDTVVEDDASSPEESETTTTPGDTIVDDHEVDCPESNQCDDDQASMMKESEDGECEEVCICRQNCEATEVGLWLAYTFAGFECGEC